MGWEGPAQGLVLHLMGRESHLVAQVGAWAPGRDMEGGLEEKGSSLRRMELRPSSSLTGSLESPARGLPGIDF